MSNLKKVQSGDPLAIPAATFNTFVDAAQDFLRRQRDIARRPVAGRPPFETVLLKNASGADRGRFDVLGIDAPVFTPADSLETFTNGIALAGVTPTASHAGNFAVLVEPIQTGQLGRAGILGSCPVKVNVVSESDAFADVEAGVTSRLKSGSSGAARILWKESGTGEKWAVVRLGNPAGGASAVPVKLTASQGGGAGVGALRPGAGVRRESSTGRGPGPRRAVWSESHATRSAAMQRERQIKAMKSARWIREHLLHRWIESRRAGINR